MFKSTLHQFFQLGQRRNHLQVPLAWLMLMVGVYGGNADAMMVNRAVNAIASHPHQIVQAANVSEQASSVKHLRDGIYLYGQSDKPEQIGQEYMVFEVQGERVIGAFYMPHSEFNCFQGSLESQQLNVTLANSETDVAESTPGEGQHFQPIAASGTSPSTDNRFDAVTFPVAVKLQNYHRIARVTANDQQILGMCKAKNN